MNIFQRWKQTTIANKSLVISGFLMAFGTLFYAGAASVQVWIMRRSAHDASLQTDKIIRAAQDQASAAQKIADASDRNAVAAKSFSASADKINRETAKAVLELRRSADDAENASAQSSQNAQRVLDATIEATRLEQRPWLAAHDGGINNFKLNEPFRATVVIWNTGKTPALYVKACTQLMEANVDLDGPMDYSYPGPGVNWHDIGALPPQTPLTFTETDEPDHHVGRTFDEIIGGTKFLFIWGQLIYLDSSGKPISINNLQRHVTRFCWEYDRLTKQFGLCRDSDANTMN
jgi:hypothetical protein